MAIGQNEEKDMSAVRSGDPRLDALSPVSQHSAVSVSGSSPRDHTVFGTLDFPLGERGSLVLQRQLDLHTSSPLAGRGALLFSPFLGPLVSVRGTDSPEDTRPHFKQSRVTCVVTLCRSNVSSRNTVPGNEHRPPD